MSEHQDYRASLYTSKGRDDVRRVMQLLEQNFRSMPHYYPHYRMTWWVLRKNIEAALADRVAALMFKLATARGHTVEAIEACTMHRDPSEPAQQLAELVAARGWCERNKARPPVPASPKTARGVSVQSPAQTLGAVLDDIEGASDAYASEPAFERMPFFSDASPNDLVALIESAKIEEVPMDASPRALASRGYVFTVDGDWHTPNGTWSAPPGRLIRDSAARDIYVGDATAVVLLIAAGDAEVRDRVGSLAILAAHAEWELLISQAIGDTSSLDELDTDGVDRLIRNAVPVHRDSELPGPGDPEDVFLLPLRRKDARIISLAKALEANTEDYVPAISWSRAHLKAIVPALDVLRSG